MKSSTPEVMMNKVQAMYLQRYIDNVRCVIFLPLMHFLYFVTLLTMEKTMEKKCCFLKGFQLFVFYIGLNCSFLPIV